MSEQLGNRLTPFYRLNTSVEDLGRDELLWSFLGGTRKDRRKNNQSYEK